MLPVYDIGIGQSFVCRFQCNRSCTDLPEDAKVIRIEVLTAVYSYGVSRKNGKILRNTRSRDKDSVRVEIIAGCNNDKCSASWGSSDFFIDPASKFVDKKYTVCDL